MSKKKNDIHDLPQIGNQCLRLRSKRMSKADIRTSKKIIDTLRHIVQNEKLVGISAPQLDINQRIFVTDIRKTETRNPLEEEGGFKVFINPEITWLSKKKVDIYEGCGSVMYGDLFGLVKRPEKIKIKALNENGEEFSIKADGIFARVILHEYDHLEGVLFTDHITDNKKLLERSAYKKLTGQEDD